MRQGGRRRFVYAAIVAGLTVGFTGVSATTLRVTSPLHLTRVASAAAPSSASIIIGTNAPAGGYQTKSVTLANGGQLSVVNFDDIEHTVTSRDTCGDAGRPCFDVFASGGGTTTSIPSASRLAAGTYDFYCRFHPSRMQGKLTIEGGTGGVTPAKIRFEQPFFRPKVLTDSHIRIKMRATSVRVLPHGPLTRMWTYGGTYPGPTII